MHEQEMKDYVSKVIRDSLRYNIGQSSLKTRWRMFIWKCKMYVGLVGMLYNAKKDKLILGYTIPRWTKDGFDYSIKPCKPAEYVVLNFIIS